MTLGAAPADGEDYTVEIVDDAATVLVAARELLARDPVLGTVVTTVTERAARQDAAGQPRPAWPRWWALVRDADGVVRGIAMCTASFSPHPAYALPMPDGAAVAVARAVRARGEVLPEVNGALPAARVIAEETARLCGGRVEVAEHTRLHELPGLDALVAPREAPGRLRAATPDDLDLVLAWYRGFDDEAAEQAGRPTGVHRDDFGDEVMLAKIAEAGVWLWEVEGPHGRPDVVHLTGVNPPALGVARVGPVFTPRLHRGRGYAGNAVAAVSRAVLEAGHRVCLFTDQANPTSNRLYAALGYRPVVDMVHLRVVG